MTLRVSRARRSPSISRSRSSEASASAASNAVRSSVPPVGTTSTGSVVVTVLPHPLGRYWHIIPRGEPGREPERRAPKRRAGAVADSSRSSRDSPLRSPLGAGVVGATELREEVVALLGPLGVLVHHLLEELGDLVLARVLRVTDVLPVVVSRLQSVVLQGD